jgi:hypothetical protein
MFLWAVTETAGRCIFVTERNADEAGTVSGIHSFIVRIWLEEVEAGTHHLDWHGHITYIGSGEQRYIKNLNDISDFIRTYLHLNGEA